MPPSFGAAHTIAGTITAPVEVLEAGVIQINKPTFVIGLAPWTAESAPLARLEGALTAAGITVTRYADARSMKWTKLLMNMIGNASSAILALPPGQTFADPRLADLEIDALREAMDVMAAAGIRPVNVEKYPLGTLAPLLRYAPKALLRPVLRRIVNGRAAARCPASILIWKAESRKTKWRGTTAQLPTRAPPLVCPHLSIGFSTNVCWPWFMIQASAKPGPIVQIV